jgi:hypothetical protein
MSAKALLSASVSAGPAAYVEDVFSTYLYTGNGSTQTITNGIDLAGEGGLVWIKQRSLANHHWLFDTARGVEKALASSLTNSEATQIGSVTSFGSSGFILGSDSAVNGTPETTASWTFRKAAKFFDVVTYTGDGNGSTPRVISHNLGSVPGVIIIKTLGASITAPSDLTRIFVLTALQQHRQIHLSRGRTLRQHRRHLPSLLVMGGPMAEARPTSPTYSRTTLAGLAMRVRIVW